MSRELPKPIFLRCLAVYSALLLVGCSSVRPAESPLVAESAAEPPKELIRPIALDRVSLSGLDLEPVKDPNQPDRRLFQRRLYRGEDLSVYVVSSESAAAVHDSYSIDELIYLINGGARLESAVDGQLEFYTGDFLVAPRGLAGEWETRGGDQFHHELSIITTRRSTAEIDPANTHPRGVDPELLSGIGLTRDPETDEIPVYSVFEGSELSVTLEAEVGGKRDLETPSVEEVIYVVAGSLRLPPTGGEPQTFYTGDFLVIPAGFQGSWESRGHELFRSLRVRKCEAG